MQSSKNLLVISVDALNKHDYDFIQTLPNFNSFFVEGAHSKEVTSVYPSVTYTCHTSLSTGHYPHAHGIFNNELPDPSKPTNQAWHWYEKEIKVPTFFDYARQAGLTTCSILWPVMAGADLTYNVPEIWSPDHSISRPKLFFKYGTNNVIWPVIKYSKLLQGNDQPYLDNFSEQVSLYVIKKYQPNVMAIHFTDLDTMRHLHGLSGKEGHEALRRIDARIGHIISAYKKMHLYEQTNIVLLGDHGTHDFDQIIELNSQFKKDGLLTTDNNGNITDWQVYACTCGGSSQIHIHKNANEATRERIDDVLHKLIDMPNSPIKQILTREEAKEQHGLDGAFDYIVEAKDKYVFRNTVTDRFVFDRSEYPNAYHGDHGYLPSQVDQKTLFLLKGPSVKQGAVINHSNLVDEGPTFCALLGLTMEKSEGNVLTDLLK